MMQRWRFLALLLFLVIAVSGTYLLLWTRDAKEPTTIKVGYIPIADAGQLLVAQHEGYFAKEDLQVELIPFAGGAPIIEAIGTGDLDIGLSGTVPLIQATTQGRSLVAFAGASRQDSDHRYQAIVVPAHSDVRTPTDMQGKTGAVNVFRSIDHAFTVAFLKKHNVDSATVHFTQLPFPQMEGALTSGQIGFASLIEPFLTRALINASVRVVDYHVISVANNLQMTVFVSQPDWLVAHDPKAAAFKRALAKATTYIAANPQAFRTILETELKLDPAVAAKMAVPVFSDTIDTASVESTARLLLELGYIAKATPTSSYIRQ
jgi:NitT/TauT family transport system substrate-binding protein